MQTGLTSQHDDHVCLIMLDISDKSSAAIFWWSAYASRLKNICQRSARETSAKCQRNQGKIWQLGKLNGGSKSQAVRHWKKQTLSLYLRLYMHARKEAGAPSQKMKSIKRNPSKWIKPVTRDRSVKHLDCLHKSPEILVETTPFTQPRAFLMLHERNQRSHT